MKNYSSPKFLNSSIGIATIMGIVVIVFLAGKGYIEENKAKANLNKASGQVIYLAKSYRNYPFRDFGKYRYLKVHTYPKVFELFIGKESGDFKPKYEKLDSLREGDWITVYYNVDESDKNEPITRRVRFIDKKEDPIFVEGSFQKSLSLFILIIAIASLVTLVILNPKANFIN